MIDLFARAAELRNAAKPFALATVVHSGESTPTKPGARMIVQPDGAIEGTVGGGALEKRVVEDARAMLEKGETEKRTYDLAAENGSASAGAVPVGMTCGGRVEVLIESFLPSAKVFIFGAGHVGKSLARLCAAAGIAHWVVDDREDFAIPALFPAASGLLNSDFRESFARLPIDDGSYIVIVTHGHLNDGVCLEEALKTSARYIGMIGSRRKVRELLESLRRRNVNVEDPRVYAPIGLHLGNGSPEEIGVSILSEIVMLKSSGSGLHMRDLPRGRA